MIPTERRLVVELVTGLQKMKPQKLFSTLVVDCYLYNAQFEFYIFRKLLHLVYRVSIQRHLISYNKKGEIIMPLEYNKTISHLTKHMNFNNSSFLSIINYICVSKYPVSRCAQFHIKLLFYIIHTKMCKYFVTQSTRKVSGNAHLISVLKYMHYTGYYVIVF